MLALPDSGMSRSVTKHRVDLEMMVDWLEANLLLLDEEISGSDLVDLLCENEIYDGDNQDFVWEFVKNIFNTMVWRKRKLGVSYPFERIGPEHWLRSENWLDHVEYAFCLLLSIAPHFRKYRKAAEIDFGEQGEIFERLTIEAVSTEFRDWRVHLTGWSRENPVKLGTVVDQLANILNESTGDLQPWTTHRSNEAGLDLVLYRPFPDGRIAFPVYLCQCASGHDWSKKLKTPDLRVWEKIVTFSVSPKKAFAMPFAISDEEFRRVANIADGLFIDRIRLLAPGRRNEIWINEGLRNELAQWVEPKIGFLPRVVDEGVAA